MLAAIILPMLVMFLMGENQKEEKVVFPETIKLSDEERLGKAVFAQKGCTRCHSIFGSGARFAPALDKVYRVRGEEYISQWLKNPKSLNAKATMPKLPLNEEEIASLVTFLRWVDMVNQTVEDANSRKKKDGLPGKNRS